MLEYESNVCLYTAFDIYKLDGYVTKMVVSGETTIISTFPKFGFWDWINFWDKGVAFPDNPWYLANSLVPVLKWGLQ